MANYRIYEPSGSLSGNVPVDLTKCRRRMFQHYHAYQCDRKAVLQEEGFGWCKQHAPSAQKARDDARNEKYAADRKRSNYRIKQARLEHDIVTAAMNWGDNGKGDGPLMEAYQALRKHLAEPE